MALRKSDYASQQSGSTALCDEVSDWRQRPDQCQLWPTLRTQVGYPTNMGQEMECPHGEASLSLQANRDRKPAAIPHYYGLGAERSAAQIFGGRSIQNHDARRCRDAHRNTEVQQRRTRSENHSTGL